MLAWSSAACRTAFVLVISHAIVVTATDSGRNVAKHDLQDLKPSLANKDAELANQTGTFGLVRSPARYRQPRRIQARTSTFLRIQNTTRGGTKHDAAHEEHVGHAVDEDDDPPLIDGYFVVYWGVFIIFMSSMCCYSCHHDRKREESFAAGSFAVGTGLSTPVGSASAKRRTASDNAQSHSRPFRINRQSTENESERDEEQRMAPDGYWYTKEKFPGTANEWSMALQDKVCDLPRNMWALNFAVALNQASINCVEGGLTLPVWLVVTLSFLMGLVQFLSVFLMTYDLDSHAAPYTSDPASPWKTSAWTVNCMKMVQVIFLTTALVSEIGQVLAILNASFQICQERLAVHKFFLFAIAIYQYCITIAILYCGVSAVLSFQDTPSIIYSSMAITFIAGFDDTFFEFFAQVFDVEADFLVKQTKDPDLPNCMAESELPIWFYCCKKIMAVFPMLLAFFVFSRAWESGEMPTRRIRSAVKAMIKTYVGKIG